MNRRHVVGKDIFRRMQERLDTYSVGFPATESGVELEILKRLFSPQDAALFLALTPRLEEPQAIAQRIGGSLKEVTAHLEDMSNRGLLFRLQSGDKVKYGAIPFVHGIWEFQVKRMGHDLAAMMDKYHDEAFSRAMGISAPTFLRTIPVQKSVPVAHHVAAYDDAVEMLRSVKQIVVTDCICRKHKQTLDQGCGKPMENCFMFGSMGQYYLDHDMGRKIDFYEALAILTASQEAGLVTQPATNQNPGGLCNCCGDCCGVLGSLRALPKPALEVFSSHFAQVDAEECIACETCLDRCQMDAIAMVEDVAQVNLDRCIGYGLCVTTCPSQAMQLVLKPEDQRRIPPVSAMDQMKLMAGKRMEAIGG